MALRFAILLSFVLTLFAREAAGSQVSFRPLESVIDERTQVFVASVTAVRSQFGDRETMRFYDVAGASSLRGPAPAGGTVVYSEIVPVMRDADGAVVGYFSPILEASGEESNVKAGTRYVFLSRGSMRDGSLLVFRVEPMSNEAKVRALLAKLPEAGAAQVAIPTPSVSSAPSVKAPAPAPEPARPRSGCALSLGDEGEIGSRLAALLVAVIAILRRRRQPVCTSAS